MNHYDVIVSGCGPIGGVLANLLASKGLSVCVLDKYAEVYPKPRAIVLDWEVMRALQCCGVAEELYPSTNPHPGTDFLGLEGQLIKLFDPQPPPYDLGWPATSTFIQPELEQMLRSALEKRAAADPRFGAELAAFEDRGSGVQVQMRDTATGEEHEASCDYLIGCDGANSMIRQRLGLPLEDLDFDEWWVVVDAWQKRDTPLPPKTTQYCWPSRPATYVVGPRNLRRWELKLLPGEQPQDFDDPDVLKAAMKPYVDVEAFKLWRHAAYLFSARVGSKWAAGRVLLAGDAVHQTPPFLGQGLCAGVRDAFNLAWKLVQVETNGASPALLDTYETERRPHVKEVIAHAKDFGLIIGEMDVERARRRDKELGDLLASGKMETTRQKFIPDLRDGFLAGDDKTRLAGQQAIQPRVIDMDGREALLDDLASLEFLYLSDGAEPQDWMSGLEVKWEAIGGKRIAIVPEMPADASQLPYECVRELGDTFARWRARTGCRALIIRPDRYIFSGVTNAVDLQQKLNRLRCHMSGEASPQARSA